MDASSCSQPVGRDCCGFYALVNYIPDPVGTYLNELRAELVAGCKLRSHVTVLPPRKLSSPPEVLIGELERRIPYLHSFNVTLGEIELFVSTGVIYLGLREGQDELREMHRSLSVGMFDFEEPFPFHPHITLAQEIPAERLQECLDYAKARWRAWTQDRSFQIMNLAFVRNVTPSRWDGLSEHVLQPAQLRQIA